MLLAVDVGNTQTVLGLYKGDELFCMWRISTDKNNTADELRVMLRSLFAADDICDSEVAGVALASVVPHLEREWVTLAQRMFGLVALAVNYEAARDLFETTYANPSEIGADRIADAIAVKAQYGAPAVVVDFGTATNIEVIDEQGRFVGGIIAPGVATSAAALFSSATRLSEIDLEEPPDAIGTSTKEAVQSGIIYGEADRVDGLVRRIFAQLGYETPVIATGGLSEAIVALSTTITDTNPELTLEGLRLIFNHSGK